MTLEFAVRLTEVLLGLAILQQSLEFVRRVAPERIWGLLRGGLAIALVLGFQPLWVEVALLLSAVFMLWRFRGPYNGGSDTMTLLILICILLSNLAPTRYWQEIALGYLAVQAVLSYFQSGWVKLINTDWRSGRALQQVFALSAYPVSEALRVWCLRTRLLWWVSWAVIVFELAFPLALLEQRLLFVALLIAAFFHLANALLFGLNHFFWIWPAAYPALLWFQDRLFG